MVTNRKVIDIVLKQKPLNTQLEFQNRKVVYQNIYIGGKVGEWVSQWERVVVPKTINTYTRIDGAKHEYIDAVELYLGFIV